MLQRSSLRVAATDGPRVTTAFRRRGRFRLKLRPSRRYRRSVRLWLTSQPSRRSSTWIRGAPQLGRTAAISPRSKSWPHPKILLPWLHRHVTNHRARSAQHAACPMLRHPVGIPRVPDQPAALAGSQTLFGARPAGPPCRGSVRRPDASTWHSRPRAASAGAPPRRPSRRTSSSTGRTSAQARRACGRSPRSSGPSTPAPGRRRSALP